MSLNQERDLHWQELILSKWFRIFPKPDFVFLINIPHDEALRRKSDIPSIDFLVERQEHYRERAVAIQAVSLDGTLPQEKLVKVIISHVSSSIPVKEKLDVQTE